MSRMKSINPCIILTIYIMLKPIYLGSSGGLQIADYFLLGATAWLLIKSRLNIKIPSGSKPVVLTFFLIFCYQVVVNVAWTAALGTSLLKPILYYAFNNLSIICFLAVAKMTDGEYIKKAAIDGCLYSLIINTVGLMVGATSGRATGFFNNPNQLGYYALIMLTFAAVFKNDASRRKHIVIVGMAIISIFASGSKAAILAMSVLLFVMVFIGKKKNWRILFAQLGLILLLMFAIWVFLYSDFSFITSNTRLMFLRNRILMMSSESDSALGSGRGYDRLFEMGSNLIWGMGEGGYDRFEALRGLELHSTFASLIVSYGWLGFAAYMFAFKRCLGHKKVLWRNLMMFSGIILYGITHNGIRSTLLWMLFILVFLDTLPKKEEVQSELEEDIGIDEAVGE